MEIAPSALREWPVDRRVDRTGVADDDPMTIEPMTAFSEIFDSRTITNFSKCW
jgi:hypothetical protein